MQRDRFFCTANVPQTLAGGMMDAKFTKEQFLDLDAQLVKIKAPKK